MPRDLWRAVMLHMSYDLQYLHLDLFGSVRHGAVYASDTGRRPWPWHVVV
jgi:hypothetical protein